MKVGNKNVNKAKESFLRFKRMQLVMILFLLLTLMLFLVQRGLSYNPDDIGLELLDTDALASEEVPEGDPVCLLIWQDDLQGENTRELMEDVLGQMRVPYECVRADGEINLDGYESVVLAVTNLGVLGEDILEIMDWTESGGRLMLAYLPMQNGYLDMISHRIGISSVGSRYTDVEKLKFVQPFMVGGEGTFNLTGVFESSMQISLDPGSELYLASDGKPSVPLIWRFRSGDGYVAAANLGYTVKSFRGFYAATYSLLGDAFAWPVINGAAFFLDDFPAPLPYGDDSRIREEYGMGFRDFLTQIWWVDMQDIAEKYGIRYTGALTETYSDETKVPLPPNKDLSRYQYFGRNLLDTGGEMALHGYNHMPLVMRDFDYRGGYDAYVYWESVENMSSSLKELVRFGEDLFPRENFTLYVPPSNILSEQAREMIPKEFPEIRAVASSYAEGGVLYSQDFSVADDGVVELPRIVGSCIADDTEKLAALSELSFHYVSTHSQRPDDAMDTGDGEKYSWEELKSGFEEYTSWLYGSAPSIRSLTGSELAAAVQRYDMLSVGQEISGGELKIKLGGFVDEAFLMIRLNGYKAGEVSGGKLEDLGGGLYLLEARKAEITVSLE